MNRFSKNPTADKGWLKAWVLKYAGKICCAFGNRRVFLSQYSYVKMPAFTFIR